MNDKERDELAEVIRSASDIWDHDIPPIINAIIAAGYGKLPDPPRYKCEACGYPDDEADSKFWRCSLCGCLDHEPATS